MFVEHKRKTTNAETDKPANVEALLNAQKNKVKSQVDLLKLQSSPLIF